MKLPTLLDKDFKLLFKDPRSLVLVFLTPIIVMAILASAFSTEGSSEQISIAICNQDDELPFNFTSSFLMPEYREDCEEAEKDVRRGELSALLVVPEGFTERITNGYGSSLDLYYDNAQRAVAQLIITSFRSQVQQLSDALGSEFIFLAWSNLKELNANLKKVQAELEIVDLNIRDARIKLLQAELRLNELQISNLELQLNMTSEQIDESVDLIRDEIFLAQERMDYVIFEVENAPWDLTNQTQDLMDKYSTHCVNPLNISEFCVEVNASIEDLLKQQNQSDEFNRKLLGDLWLIRSSLENLTSAVDSIGDFDSLRPYLQEFETTRLAALENISALRLQLDDMLSMVNSFQANLEKTTEVLDRYVSIDPVNIVRPIALTELPVLPRATNLNTMAPALLLVILLFITLITTTTHIVQEKNAGTMVRMLLSPLPMTIYLIEKLIYMLLLALFGVAGMLVVLLFFGVTFPVGTGFFPVLIAASIVFISMGFFIGAVSRTETTAMLSSLVIGLPMMFLSGAFIPLILMSRLMQDISLNLPLTQLIIQLQKVSLYGQAASINSLAGILVLSLVLFVISLGIIKGQLKR
ncbi:MAG: ABC transporter permease [Nanoarchaeota archaeon]|nr:ABC transporter permease [Nanoarchaeota archaeon]